MPDYEPDPAANTQQFRAFVQKGGSEPTAKSGNAGLVIGVVAAVVIVGVVIALAFAVL